MLKLQTGKKPDASSKSRMQPARGALLQHKCACGGGVPVGDQDQKVRRKVANAKSAGSSASFAPPIVHDVLSSPGQPLDRSLRAFMEPKFGHDFSRVRVHLDDKAADSARSISALAYTVGTDIVFGRGNYRPAAPAGCALLAHELAHLVQQGSAPPTGQPLPISHPQDAQEHAADRAASAILSGVPVSLAGNSHRVGVYRASDPAAAAATAPAAAPAPASPETLIRQWLDQHQFAPPAKQPEDAAAERTVLLNGEEMTVSDAVKLAAADKALAQPPELISSVITALIAPPVAADPRGLPFIGPGNDVPGINLAGPRDGFQINPEIAKIVEFSTIDDYLDKHGFAAPEIRDPTGNAAVLDGKQTTVDQVADTALALLGQYPSLKK